MSGIKKKLTELKVLDKKLYLSPIIDLFNQEIAIYELSERPVFSQVIIILKKAFRKIPDNTNLVLQSDQGWQYQMQRYQHLLRKKGIMQSMPRKENCLNNAIIENFFGVLKSEMFYTQKFKSVDNLKLKSKRVSSIIIRKE